MNGVDMEVIWLINFKLRIKFYLHLVTYSLSDVIKH